MIGRIFNQMVFSTGAFVLSFLGPGFPPLAKSLASAAPAVTTVGSGSVSTMESSGGLGSACGCFPVALVSTTDVMPLKKLLASCSTASPL